MTDSAAISAFYGRWAGLYDLLARYTPGLTALRHRTIGVLGLKAGEKVVEMGCGTGANLSYLHDGVGPTGHVIGLDLTPQMLERARNHPELKGRHTVHVIQGDATRPPLRETDALLATFVVGMLEDPAAAVDRWCDLLPPDGRLVLLDAAPTSRSLGTPLNPIFRAFVAASAPPTSRNRYDRSLVAVLKDRITAAREALASRGTILIDEEYALGFVRLTAACV